VLRRDEQARVVDLDGGSHSAFVPPKERRGLCCSIRPSKRRNGSNGLGEAFH